MELEQQSETATLLSLAAELGKVWAGFRKDRGDSFMEAGRGLRTAACWNRPKRFMRPGVLAPAEAQTDQIRLAGFGPGARNAWSRERGPLRQREDCPEIKRPGVKRERNSEARSAQAHVARVSQLLN